jgi:hypothetical protein
MMPRQMYKKDNPSAEPSFRKLAGVALKRGKKKARQVLVNGNIMKSKIDKVMSAKKPKKTY